MNTKRVWLTATLCLVTVVGILLFNMNFSGVGNGGDALMVSSADEVAPIIADPQDIPQDTIAQGSVVNSVKIRGRVLDQDAAPIVGVGVLINVTSNPNIDRCDDEIGSEFELNESTYMLQTDDKGEFKASFNTLAVNEKVCLLINAAREGYAEKLFAIPWNNERAGRELIEIELQAGKVVSGRVLNPNGEPVAMALINTVRNGMTGNVPLFNGQPRAPCGMVISGKFTPNPVYSDEQGFFSINIQEEKIDHCLQAIHGQWTRSERVWVDRETSSIKLILQSPLNFSGTVHDTDNNPVAGLTLMLTRLFGESGNPITTSTQTEGQFEFASIDSGSYQLEVQGNRYALPNLAEEIVIRDSIEDYSIAVFALSLLHGRIVNDNGQPVEGVIITARSPFATNQSSTQATSNDKGEFELPSRHQSPQVRDMHKLAQSFLNDSEEEVSLNTVCLDFYHPNYQRLQRGVEAPGSALNLDTVFLSQAPVTVRGRISNYRGDGTKAKLIFRFQAKNDDNNPIPRCDDLAFERQTETTEKGEFQINLDQLGDYEIEAESSTYWRKKINITIGSSSDYLDLQVE